MNGFIVQGRTGDPDKYTMSGIDMPDGEIVKITRDTLILKVPGHKYWSSRGESSYAPAEFQVFRIVAVTPRGAIKVEEVTAIDARAKGMTGEEVRAKLKAYGFPV